MANEKTNLPAETSKDTDLAVGIPSWIPAGDTTGTAMSAEDLRLPRLLIAQGLSPELTPGNPRYIEELKMFQLFNELSKEVYGMGPLTFIPVRHDVRRIEFRPRSEGGGVLDMNVPPNDPRTLWTTAPDGKRVPPRATKFNEYVVLLVTPEGVEPIVISIKDTNKENRRATTNLNGYISMPSKVQVAGGYRRVQLPIYGKRYTIESGSVQNDKGTFGVPIIRQAGILTDAELGKRAMKFASELQGKTIVVEREPGSDDEFDTEAMDATSVQAEM